MVGYASPGVTRHDGLLGGSAGRGMMWKLYPSFKWRNFPVLRIIPRINHHGQDP